LHDQRRPAHVLDDDFESVLVLRQNRQITGLGDLHARERGRDGRRQAEANTQTAALMKQVKAPAYLAISERTMGFDGKGKCVSGC
jgi:hypothetical protein